MTVKASISLTDRQDAFARGLVADGQYPSLSAVVQRGLEMLREETEARAVETDALRTLLTERRAGAFLTEAEARARTGAMLDKKRAALGLEG
ncbi:MAG: type II toxin-antitoxin system ParD family antitoxin [Paracoccus sp. (in: a-proteobacteria)]|uniref:ribbon-helix-helix domain-containing protein n=1 Tax=Paracoccus sp. TaxID=267 RepID=UPI0026E100C7|nr:type II toxin-antitoxin system ParD family antitoxin [Paracoccus sp. (in: a-proteobacteria)]MDO5613682.1 type II toxin-antitoxin system ParD family antitoxin [Paracoccus sp. (in: a-proteobacteria)]